ncbi:helix-hairpin-helix domain-containing protein [Bifidobacterium felsineum]|uniref:Competence protein ComEA n=1 Tax=Bifidobacterium felsineum TaxID=2045440 RepID=A0A2M9HL19_9BIFI|nr:helix-hairpin-helix domain-containing protein [Bifidobacterium felsineum]PJM77507.1 competence protein ComEA [Bifidobacterium felsineum]
MALTTGHTLVIILLLVAVLGLSFTLIVQQSMNLTALAQGEHPNALSSTNTENIDGESIDNSDDRLPDSSSNAVPSPEQSHPEDTSDADQPAQQESDSRININTASLDELQTITGIGPVTAQRIIDHRKSIGRYTSVDQLLDVTGIGSKTLEKIRGQVRVE